MKRDFSGRLPLIFAEVLILKELKVCRVCGEDRLHNGKSRIGKVMSSS